MKKNHWKTSTGEREQKNNVITKPIKLRNKLRFIVIDLERYFTSDTLVFDRIRNIQKKNIIA